MNLYRVSVYVILPRTLFIEAFSDKEALEIAKEKHPESSYITASFICKIKDIIKHEQSKSFKLSS